MRTKIIIILSIIGISLIMVKPSFATPMSYQEYQQEAKSYCEDGKPWYAETTRNTQKITYPELNSRSINAWINLQRSIAENESPKTRENILTKLDPLRIGAINDTSRILEVVQIAYHARMNIVFDCAIIESRKNILESLRKTIKGQSEVLEKIKKEELMLNQKAKQCIPKGADTNSGKSSSDLTQERLINTAVLQYCHYRKYLTYLESNLTENISGFNTIDSKIGEGGSGMINTTSEGFQRNFLKKQEQIRDEIYIADRSIPRAISAFKEMERTYAVHLLLVIIYDDYARLRDNLARYMSSTSQLFEKANNAMSPN